MTKDQMLSCPDCGKRFPASTKGTHFLDCDADTPEVRTKTAALKLCTSRLSGHNPTVGTTVWTDTGSRWVAYEQPCPSCCAVVELVAAAFLRSESV